tara:strand:+ start:99 stop:281 length:183 start_codon:yes stop_codon:yes gene_type:complete
VTYSIIGATALILFLFFFAFGIFLVELIPWDAWNRIKTFLTKTNTNTNTNKEIHHDHRLD